MRLADVNLDWCSWFGRWEAMQNCYVPKRLFRFELMLDRPGLSAQEPIRILDLGSGPGSLALRALDRYRRAHILAVDFDPVLLRMGQHLAQGKGGHIQFIQADIRQDHFWQKYQESFELIISATALHWLNVQHLAELYQRSFRSLEPGGWLMNSDHIASDDPKIQEQYRQDLQTKRRAAFRACPADKWNDFWKALGCELAELDLAALGKADEYWEGSDDGQPRHVHLQALRDCGFEQVKLYWQQAGEAIVGARKPPQR